MKHEECKTWSQKREERRIGKWNRGTKTVAMREENRGEIGSAWDGITIEVKVLSRLREENSIEMRLESGENALWQYKYQPRNG